MRGHKDQDDGYDDDDDDNDNGNDGYYHCGDDD